MFFEVQRHLIVGDPAPERPHHEPEHRGHEHEAEARRGRPGSTARSSAPTRCRRSRPGRAASPRMTTRTVPRRASLKRHRRRTSAMMSRSSVGCAERRTCSSMRPPCGFDGARPGRMAGTSDQDTPDPDEVYAGGRCRPTSLAFQPVGDHGFRRQQGRPQAQEIPPEPLAPLPRFGRLRHRARLRGRRTGIPRCWPPRCPGGPWRSGPPRPGRRCWPRRPCRRWNCCRRAARRTPARPAR